MGGLIVARERTFGGWSPGTTSAFSKSPAPIGKQPSRNSIKQYKPLELIPQPLETVPNNEMCTTSPTPPFFLFLRPLGKLHIPLILNYFSTFWKASLVTPDLQMEYYWKKWQYHKTPVFLATNLCRSLALQLQSGEYLKGCHT